jgi:N-acetylglutamate synthase-like GNAT family acetyltransferase
LVEFIIRPADRNEFPEIVSLIHSVHINPFGLNWRCFLVAVTEKNELLGCGQIKRHSDGSCELASIAVQKQRRNQGLARSVIEELLRREKKRPVYLMCRGQLQTLYEKFDFHAIGSKEMPPYFKRIYLLERILNSRTNPADRLRIMKLD